MAIKPVKKVSLIALKECRGEILSRLQSFGLFEIIDLAAKPEALPDGLTAADPTQHPDLPLISEDLERLEEAIGIVGSHDETRRSLMDPPLAATLREITEVVSRDREFIMSGVREALSVREKIAGCAASMQRILGRIGQIEPWRALDIPVEDLCDTREAVVAAGTIPAPQWPAFIGDMREMNTLDLEEIRSDADSVYMLALCHRLESGTLHRALTRAGYAKAEFAGEKGIPADILSDYARELEELESRIGELEAGLAGMTWMLEPMKLLFDGLSLLRDRGEAALRFGDTRRAFYAAGWIPADQCERFRRSVAEVTGAAEIEIRDPAPGECAPTLIRNNRLVEPFESITEMYTTPQRHEMDPNVLMAPFFFAFFGMMVSDAGYGLVIAALGSVMYYLMRRKGANVKLVMVVALGGVSTLLWGALFGGWFGFTWRPLWFNPLEDPLTMLVVCFALGLVQIMTGLIIKAVAEFRTGYPAAAIFGNICWVLAFLGVLLMTAPALGTSPLFRTVGTMGKYLALAAVAGISLGKAGIVFAGKWGDASRKRTPFSAARYALGGIMSGVMALYGVTGYFSDILSYSRLFALGLATGVIGMVINTIIAMLVSGTGAMAVIGWAAAVVVFAGGHLFNIAINALGAFVHTSRLQYIEYFGKFLEGGGRPFRPLAMNAKYHRLRTGQ